MSEGPAGPAGVQGPQGPPGSDGAEGIAGQATIIVGSFGATRTPAALPVTGLIPAGWDGAGRPPAAHQMLPGESLTYTLADPGDPQYAHLFTFLAFGGSTGWTDLGRLQGPPGAAGPPGPQGGTGPQGPQGPAGAGSAPGPWTDVTGFMNGCGGALQVRLINDGTTVEMRGLITRPPNAVTRVIAIVIPAGFRPAPGRTVAFAGFINSTGAPGAFGVSLGPAGNLEVVALAGTTTWPSGAYVDGMSYSVT